MKDPITPVISTIILMAFPVVTAYFCDYMFTLIDKIKEIYERR